MIRPFTFVCMLLAGASGLYLYQSKHRAQMLDRDIGQTVKQIEGTKERIGMMRAEWALQNDPERLKDLVKAHAPSLHPLAPTQFVAMADIASRLPAPIPPSAQPAAPEPEETPVAAAPAAEPAPAPAVAQAAPPAAAKPAPARVAVASAPAPKPEPRAEAKAEPKPEPKPDSVVASKHAAPHQGPVQLASTPSPVYRPAPAPVLPVSVNAAAVAPGTVGASVLRAMRANAGYSYTAPAPTYSPPPAYAPPQPSYAPAPAASLLGGRPGALPPPTPYAFR